MTIIPLTLFSLAPIWIILIVVIVILVVVVIVLYFWSKKQQKKMDEAQSQIDAQSQTVTMLIIDKKKMRLNQSGLPQEVINQTPKYVRRSKVPIVKAKVGPKIILLICDTNVYDLVPVKQEVKATISGIYLTSVRSLRGPALTPQKKEGFWKRMKKKYSNKS